MKTITSIIFTLFIFQPSWAETLTLESSAQPPQLIELYTSEGCSSCPPADKYVSGLKQREGLWTEFVPAVFHVDYWDWIGWKDRFASEDYSKRQRLLYKNKQLSSVYTPGFLISGEEWRGFFGKRVIPQNTLTPASKLALTLDKGEYFLSFEGNSTEVGRAHIALLGMDIQSYVARGENAGRNLKHDFVVLDWLQLPSGQKQWRGKIADTKNVRPRRYAIAAWVDQAGSTRPLQVLGGYIDTL